LANSKRKRGPRIRGDDDSRKDPLRALAPWREKAPFLHTPGCASVLAMYRPAAIPRSRGVQPAAEGDISPAAFLFVTCRLRGPNHENRCRTVERHFVTAVAVCAELSPSPHQLRPAPGRARRVAFRLPRSPFSPRRPPVPTALLDRTLATASGPAGTDGPFGPLAAIPRRRRKTGGNNRLAGKAHVPAQAGMN
jgi:hypothetical protein